MGFTPDLLGWLKLHKSVNVIHSHQPAEEEKKNHTIISIGAEKVFYNIKHFFMIKILSKLGKEGDFPNFIKTKIYKNPTSNIIFL